MNFSNYLFETTTTTTKKSIRSQPNHCCRPLRFIQTWIVPDSYGLPPNYGSFNAATQSGHGKNQVLHLASDVKDSSSNAPVKLNQDVNCYASELELGKNGKIRIFFFGTKIIQCD